MNLFKKTISCLIVLASVHTYAAQKLTVGTSPVYPPFEYADEKNILQGFGMDIVRGFTKFYPEYALDIQGFDFRGLIPSLLTGRIDLLIASMTITYERSQRVAFTKPYLKTNLSVAVQKSKANKIIRLNDMFVEGTKVGVLKGSSGESVILRQVEKRGARIDVISSDTEGQMFLEFMQGKIDVMISDEIALVDHIIKQPHTANRYVLMKESFRPEFWGIAVKRGNDKLLGQLNAYIDEIRKNTTENSLFEIANRHLSKHTQELNARGLNPNVVTTAEDDEELKKVLVEQKAEHYADQQRKGTSESK